MTLFQCVLRYEINARFPIFDQFFKTMSLNKQGLLKALGPGILFTGTCVGVSHLVQSTRAGADFGYALILFIILANLFKYPFFEFGSRYATATKRSLLEGYLAEGKWILWIYFLLSVASMFTVTAAVTFVTAGMLNNLTGFTLPPAYVSGILLLCCMFVLAVGKYGILDTLLKIVGAVLLVSTLVAFFAAINKGHVMPVEGFIPKELTDRNSIIFIIALMGWMPCPLDFSTWNSLWTIERMKQTRYIPKFNEVLFDFKLGYFITTILALCFLTLGAHVMYGTGVELSGNSTVFSNQVVTLFTSTLGDWSYFIIATAAFSTMFSTTITVLDGYGRSMGETVRLLLFKNVSVRSAYTGMMATVAIVSFLFILLLSANLKELVDLATILSFLIAPVIAFINYRVITSTQISSEYQPGEPLRWLAKSGIAFLTVFTIIYVLVYFL